MEFQFLYTQGTLQGGREDYTVMFTGHFHLL